LLAEEGAATEKYGLCLTFAFHISQKVHMNGHTELPSGTLAVRNLGDVVLAFHPLLDRWAHEEEGSMCVENQSFISLILDDQ